MSTRANTTRLAGQNDPITMKNRLAFLGSLLLPILGAVYPVIFLYGHNVKVTPASSLAIPLSVTTLLGVAVYGLFYLFQRSRLHAGLSAFLFMIFFNAYGAIYTRLLTLNIAQIEHYTLLPFIVLVVIYGAFFISRLRLEVAAGLQTIMLFLTAGLVLFNLIPVVRAEAGRLQASAAVKSMTLNGTVVANAPDIYFIIFDEYAGFDALHEFWKYDGYKEFVAFLEDKGFYVAEHSHGYYPDTLYEISSRLNLQHVKNQKPAVERTPVDSQKLYDAIADNKVMRIVKSYGYTTVALDGSRTVLKTKTKIKADYSFEYEAGSQNIELDDFTVLFFEQSMVRAFPAIYKQSYSSIKDEQTKILYGLDKAEHLQDIPTPKFVYLHVLLPHPPFIFDENGEALDYDVKVNWNYYLGQHKYATRRAKELITSILANADPKRPPVIILQSDHGARMDTQKSPLHVGLDNYEEKYKTSIMNAMFFPGYDYSTLTKDLSPLEPLVIALNHYLNAGVEVEELSAGN